MLTTSECIVWWWKEYFNDLLNPVNRHFKEEADFGVSSVMTGIEVSVADRDGDYPFQEGGPQGVLQLLRDHTPQPLWERFPPGW